MTKDLNLVSSIKFLKEDIGEIFDAGFSFNFQTYKR